MSAEHHKSGRPSRPAVGAPTIALAHETALFCTEGSAEACGTLLMVEEERKRQTGDDG